MVNLTMILLVRIQYIRKKLHPSLGKLGLMLLQAQIFTLALQTSNGLAPAPTPTPAYPDSGSLYLWGDNAAGQLGDNTTADKKVPTQVFNGGEEWAIIDAGKQHFGAIKNDGTLWTWGDNTYGELGSENINSRSYPENVAI